MRIAIVKEAAPGERRVALVPESAKKLIEAGYDISMEAGAGMPAGFPDAAYGALNISFSSDPAAIVSASDLVLKVNSPEMDDPAKDLSAWMRPDTLLIGSLMPLRYLRGVRSLASCQATAFSTDAIPRTTRAQPMDTLSSMANIAGYKGVLLAAAALNRYFPMLTTAAGMVLPAKVFVIGAGVAGLQAIATARRLGANVVATDVRPEVKEQIESVGAKYVGIEPQESVLAGGGYAKELSAKDQALQRELLALECERSDVVLTTALIGGVFAPRLIDAEVVGRMKPGSVIVDLAADGGGNCELSIPGETVNAGGVTILAPLNITATMAYHASLLFSRNLTAFVMAFTKNKGFVLDLEDEIQSNAIITRAGEIVHARTRDAMQKAGL